jgi:zinc protease
MSNVRSDRPLVARLLLCALTLLAVAVAGAAPQPQPQPDVLRATLANGLQVILVRDTLAPVVSTSVNYLVGSDETAPGFPGTAHALEHMMFRGSPGLSADQLANIGSVVGGNFNANTRESLTQYLYTVPARDLDVALHIEAIRMRGIDGSAAEWQHERGAIEQEVAQDLSDPGYVLYTKIRTAMFTGTPYEHDALGTRPSFDKTTAQQLKQFHDTWYAPNNAILVITGDLDPEATLKQITQMFGDIPRKQLPARPAFDLKPVKPASFKVDTDHPSGTLMLAMRVPGLGSPDFAALEVLSDVLSSQRFDLYGLVPQGKALDAGFAIDPLPQAGMAYAQLGFVAGQDSAQLESEVRAILAKVAREGVPPELVDAAKRQERSGAQFQKNSIADFASVWSDAVALYGLSSPDEDLARIEKVTVADVNRVAHKYLDLDHAISAVMLPKGSGHPVPGKGGGFGGQEQFALGEGKPTALPPWAQSALQRMEVPSSTLHPVVSTLPNGLTLIVQTTDVSDTTTVLGHIRNRSEMQQAPGEEGVGGVLDRLLSHGTDKLDRLAFQQALDAIGAQEKAGTDFSVATLAEDFDRGVELLAANELHPALPAAAEKIIQQQVAQAVAARNVSPGFLTQRALLQGIYPASDPSQRYATKESVSGLTPEKVRAYYESVFRPDMTTIVVIGKVTPEHARAVIERHFGAWTATGPAPAVDPPAAPLNKPGSVAVPDASRVQDEVILVHNLTLTRTDPDYYPLELGNAVLGGSFYSTRLSIDLRKNTGLVYSVGAGLQAGRTRGAYTVEYACDPQNVAKAEAIVKRDIRAMQTTPVGDEELGRVKALLLRQIPLSESSVSDIGRGMLGRRDLGIPLEEPLQAARRYIELTPADIQRVFQKWLRPDDLVRISQGPVPPP